ncbi:alpha/beta hydrolase family protein [Nitrospira sp. Nam74]
MQVIVRLSPDSEWQDLTRYDLTKQYGLFPLGFGKDPHVLYVSDILEGRRAVFRLDLNTSSKELVLADPHYDVFPHLLYSREFDRMLGLEYWTDGSHTLYWDKGIESMQRRIDESLPGTVDHIFHSAAGRHLIRSSSSTSSPRILFMDEAANRVSTISDLYPDIPKSLLTAPSRIRFNARDGMSIEGYLTLPPEHTRARVPLVVFPHGGPAARDYGTFDPWVQFFASHGWAVLQVNFRGSTGYGETFTRTGVRRWGLEMQDDLTDGVRWAIDHQMVDADRVCLVGASYGGYAALMGIIETPELYACAISVAPVTDLRRLLGDARFYYNASTYWEQQLGHRWFDRRRLEETSPIPQAGRIKTPLLLIHAKDDVTVLVDHSRDMVQALNNAGFKEFQYLELPWGGHQLLHQPSRLELFSAMERFLKKYLD